MAVARTNWTSWPGRGGGGGPWPTGHLWLTPATQRHLLGACRPQDRSPGLDPAWRHTPPPVVVASIWDCTLSVFSADTTVGPEQDTVPVPALLTKFLQGELLALGPDKIPIS